MAKHTLNWFDGKTLEFEDFAPGNNSLNIDLPSTTKREHNTHHTQLYVRPEDYATARANYNRPTPVEQNKLRVGILRSDTPHPFPKGLYIPYKLSNYGEAVHQLEGLDGDFILNEQTADKKPVKADEAKEPAF